MTKRRAHRCAGLASFRQPPAKTNAPDFGGLGVAAFLWPQAADTLASLVGGRRVLPVSFQPLVVCSHHLPLSLASNAEGREDGGVFHQLAALELGEQPGSNAFPDAAGLLQWFPSL